MGKGGGSDAGRRAIASTINIRQTLGRGRQHSSSRACRRCLGQAQGGECAGKKERSGRCAKVSMDQGETGRALKRAGQCVLVRLNIPKPAPPGAERRRGGRRQVWRRSGCPRQCAEGIGFP
jgi:hypothetical protein